MIKLIIVPLFFIAALHVFSEEVFDEPHNPLQERQDEALLYFSGGTSHLLLHEPARALEEFQIANSLLDRSDISSCPIGFLITYGQAIAYDCLGFHAQCKESIGSLFIHMNHHGSADDLRSNKSTDGAAEREEPKESLQFLQSLASLAPSPEVRELLFSLIEDMAEELLPAFKFAEPLTLGDDFSFNTAQDAFSIHLCKHKSIWKKFKTWCLDVADRIDAVLKIIKGAKDVKRAYEELRDNSRSNKINYEGYSHKRY